MRVASSLFSQSSVSYCLPLSQETKNPWKLESGFCRPAGGYSLKPMCLKFPASNMKIFLRNGHAYADKLVVNVATPKTSLNGMVDILEYYEDIYDGVIIDPESLPSNTTAFSAALRSSLSYWKLKGKKGVWLKILLDKVDLVPIAIKEGFVYHHTEPHYVMLTYWIPEGPCMLPAGASHQIGVGGFVINDNGEVLVVKERKCLLSCSGIWKLPTGLIDKILVLLPREMYENIKERRRVIECEEIFSGAIREVKEETGIDTTFSEVLAFRHAHHVTFEKSDLFFVCMLRPLSFDITIDEAEIQAAKWMPLHEFMEQPFHKEDQMMKRVLDVCVARCENCYGGFSTQLVISKFDERVSHLYYGGLNNI